MFQPISRTIPEPIPQFIPEATSGYGTSCHIKVAIFPVFDRLKRNRDCVKKAIAEAHDAGIENAIVIHSPEDVKQAADHIKDNAFAVIVPDPIVDAPSVCLQQMIENHRQMGGNLAALARVRPGHTRRFNIIVPQLVKRRHKFNMGDIKPISILNIIEKPGPDVAPSHIAVVGRYIFEPHMFADLSRSMQSTDGLSGMMDVLTRSIAVSPLHGLLFDSIHLLDEDRKSVQTPKEPPSYTLIGGWSGGYRTTLSNVAFSPLT